MSPAVATRGSQVAHNRHPFPTTPLTLDVTTGNFLVGYCGVTRKPLQPPGVARRRAPQPLSAPGQRATEAQPALTQLTMYWEQTWPRPRTPRRPPVPRPENPESGSAADRHRQTRAGPAAPRRRDGGAGHPVAAGLDDPHRPGRPGRPVRHLRHAVHGHRDRAERHRLRAVRRPRQHGGGQPERGRHRRPGPGRHLGDQERDPHQAVPERRPGRHEPAHHGGRRDGQGAGDQPDHRLAPNCPATPPSTTSRSATTPARSTRRASRVPRASSASRPTPCASRTCGRPTTPPRRPCSSCPASSSASATRAADVRASDARVRDLGPPSAGGGPTAPSVGGLLLTLGGAEILLTRRRR